jgi:hypothetical protein
MEAPTTTGKSKITKTPTPIMIPNKLLGELIYFKEVTVAVLESNAPAELAIINAEKAIMIIE